MHTSATRRGPRTQGPCQRSEGGSGRPRTAPHRVALRRERDGARARGELRSDGLERPVGRLAARGSRRAARRQDERGPDRARTPTGGARRGLRDRVDPRPPAEGAPRVDPLRLRLARALRDLPRDDREPLARAHHVRRRDAAFFTALQLFPPEPSSSVGPGFRFRRAQSAPGCPQGPTGRQGRHRRLGRPPFATERSCSRSAPACLILSAWTAPMRVPA